MFVECWILTIAHTIKPLFRYHETIAFDLKLELFFIQDFFFLNSFIFLHASEFYHKCKSYLCFWYVFQISIKFYSLKLPKDDALEYLSPPPLLNTFLLWLIIHSIKQWTIHGSLFVLVSRHKKTEQTTQNCHLRNLKWNQQHEMYSLANFHHSLRAHLIGKWDLILAITIKYNLANRNCLMSASCEQIVMIWTLTKYISEMVFLWSSKIDWFLNETNSMYVYWFGKTNSNFSFEQDTPSYLISLQYEDKKGKQTVCQTGYYSTLSIHLHLTTTTTITSWKLAFCW